MTSYQIIRPAAPMRDKPSQQSGLETEALFGEEVSILEKKGDWVRARLDTDGYEAWLERSDLGQLPPPTHRINVVRALITSGKDIKTPNLGYLPFGALVAVMAETDGVAEIALGNRDGDGNVGGGRGYIPARHTAPLDAPLDAPPDAPLDAKFADWVQCAEQFLGVPYRWGGRDSIGMDCSALVQLALMAGGMAAPRNSGDQFRALGATLPEGTALKRGDLIFWRGHVGIMQDAKRLLHANAWHGMVASEPLTDARTRIQKTEGAITRMARMAGA